jgi:hypothetical protein
MQACVAGLFNLRMEDTIDVTTYAEMFWYDEFVNWCIEELRVHPIVMECGSTPEIYHICIWQKADGIGHATINKGSKIIHDPDSRDLREKQKGIAVHRIAFVPLGHESQLYQDFSEFIEDSDE